MRKRQAMSISISNLPEDIITGEILSRLPVKSFSTFKSVSKYFYTLIRRRISISGLPENISEQIILRLPVKIIIRFKSINKSFYSLIRSSAFVNKHMHHSIQKNDITLVYPYNYQTSRRTAQSFSLKSLPSTECHGVINGYSFIRSQWRMDSFCGSSNGLICICLTDINFSKYMEKIILLNPSTKEFKEIQVPEKSLEPYLGRIISKNLYWFCYDYKIADYKLVRVVGFHSHGKKSFEVEVYTLGLDSWRRIEDVSYKFERHQPGLLVNGALHWFVASVVDQVKVLVSFDIANEKFLELPLPKERLTLEDAAKYKKSVGELGGRLCLLFHVSGVRVDVWVMQEYGVSESWTKKFVITEVTITRAMYLSLRHSFVNNEIVLQCDQELILYDPKSKKHRKVAVCKIDTRTDAAIKYETSLVSLNSGRFFKQVRNKKAQSQA